MATISKVTLETGSAITKTELTGTDTLGSKNGVLMIENVSGVSATINLLGDEATTADAKGCGVGDVDVSGGYDVVVADGETVPVKLNEISGFIAGDTTDLITGGTADVRAWIQ